MSTSILSKLRAAAGKAPLAGWIPVVLAAAGFSGLIAASMIPASPTSELVELRRQVAAARASAAPGQAAPELDQAAATLEAARRVIEHEGQRTWTLRSYDRAQALLEKTEGLLEQARHSPPPGGLDEVVPAG